MVTIRTRLIHKQDRQDITVDVSSILTMSTKLNNMTKQLILGKLKTNLPTNEVIKLLRIYNKL